MVHLPTVVPVSSAQPGALLDLTLGLPRQASGFARLTMQALGAFSHFFGKLLRSAQHAPER